MDRTHWLRVLERWFNPAQLENLPGWQLPKDVAIFAGAPMNDEGKGQKLKPIRVLLRDIEASFGDYVHGYVQGTFLVADAEACVLVDEERCCFVPWDTIVCIVC